MGKNTTGCQHQQYSGELVASSIVFSEANLLYVFNTIKVAGSRSINTDADTEGSSLLTTTVCEVTSIVKC